MKQKIVTDSHQLGEQAMVYLQVALSKESSTFYRNVRRLVYSAFVGAINFQKDGLYVINIDCNGYNNRIENLNAVIKSVKSRRSFKRQRVPESHLKRKYRTNWKYPSYGAVARRKPVMQINIATGIIENIFQSITEATTVTGFDSKEIINTAKGRRPHYKGYSWRYYIE